MENKLNQGSDFQPLKEIGGVTQQAIMPIIAAKDGHYWPLGTGFIICADGLMMTATHVLNEAYLKGTGMSTPAGSSKAEMELYALYVTDEEHGPNNEHLVGGLWPIDRTWFTPGFDIAFCWLRAMTRDDVSVKFPVVKLSPGLPIVGQDIIGFGYLKMESKTVEYTSDKISLHYSQDTAFTKGKIKEIHPVSRDKAMLNFPVFHTDARFDAGMSGGPIFNERGTVCGVICSSMPSLEKDSNHISYGSLIYPIMGSAIDIILKEGSDMERVRIHKLVDLGHIKVDDTYEKVDVTYSGTGTLNVKVRV